MLGIFERLMPLATRLRLGAAALTLTCAVGAVSVPQAAADTASVESVSSSNMPSDWAAGRNWGFDASACGSESCVAVGNYEYNTSSWTHGLIVPSNDGVAGPGVAAPLPSNATGAPVQYATLADVSCWAAGSCLAVGYYTDSSGTEQALVLPINDGAPGAPEEATLPQGGTGGDLVGVSCSSSGSCVAVGDYYNSTSGDDNAMLVNVSNGVPATAITVAAPVNTASRQGAELYDVSCQATGACVAVGYYTADDSHDYDGWVVPIDNGSAGTAQTMQLPVNADQNTGVQNVDVELVACPASGTCVATGYYKDASSNWHDLVVPITNGVAGQGVEAPPPSGANSSSVDFYGLSCQSSGDCLAVGSYTTTATETQAVAIPISNGVPSPAATVALPSNADPSNQLAELNGVACPATGACIAAGDYYNLTDNPVPMTVSFNAGALGSGVQTAAPADESTAGNAFAGLDTIACAATSCAATGNYSNQTTDAPYVLSIQAPLAISSTSLPGGAVGTAYSQTLAATGAWGAYSWSVSSGSLPAGLSLNAQTGVVSGTPTTGGTSTFTITATGTGVPAQTATQAYSVAITAPPVSSPPTPVSTPAAVPMLTLLSHSATVSKNKFSLKLSCSAAACHGSLKLRISETVTVKRGKKRVRKHETVAIGSAGFSLLAGQTKSIKVTINAVGRRALAARHRLSVTVLDTLDGVKGTLGHVTLKPAPVKHKKKH